MKLRILLYRLRKWLWFQIIPKNLTVYLFDRVKEADGTGLVDPDGPNGWEGWGKVKIYWANTVYINLNE